MNKYPLEIWYMNTSYFRDGIMGKDWLTHRNLMPDVSSVETLAKTHVHLKDIEAEGVDIYAALERAYVTMQAEYWSPLGEAKPLIIEKHLGHTSMSVGDIVRHGNDVYFVDSVGFAKIN